MVNARFLLDTNVLSEPARVRPNAQVLKKMERHQDEVATASVVWHELVYGCRRLPPSEKRELLERFLSDLLGSSLAILPYDEQAAEWHGGERARLARKGLTPAFADGQIAAIAKSNGLVLVTNNVRNYRHFEGLQMENWHVE